MLLSQERRGIPTRPARLGRLNNTSGESPRTSPPEFPLGLRVRVSGSGQSLPLVPWIALLDRDVTTTATDGLYLVYVFDRTVERVYLSTNQGATQHLRQAESDGFKGKAAEASALIEIRAET